MGENQWFVIMILEDSNCVCFVVGVRIGLLSVSELCEKE